MRSPTRAVVVCLAVAAASLLVHAGPGFDPWAWVVWGRQLAALDLDTSTGLSWKPLPVVFTTAFAPFGGAAPLLWLLVARTGGLLAVAGAYRLAARFGGHLAGVVAAVLLVLTPGADARSVRLLAQGNVEPLVAAACLWAVDRHLAGRPRQTLALLAVAGLARPEVWPFFGLYALWHWRRDPADRPLTVGLVAAIPLLWFGGDLLGSGSALTGAQTASVVVPDVAHRLALAASAVGALVLAPAWVAAVVGVAVSRRRGDRVPLVLAGTAGVWLSVVAGMTVVFGYAALGRFLLPAAALVCVLAGVGVAALVAAGPAAGGGRRVLVGVVLVAVALPFAVPRAAGLGSQLPFVAEREASDRALAEMVEAAGGPAVVREHGDLAVELDREVLSAWPALAWTLDVPLGRISGDHHTVDRGVVFARAGGQWERELRSDTDDARRLAGDERWTLFAVERTRPTAP